MKKVFIVLAILLVAAGMIVFLSAYIAAGFDFTKLSNVKYETNTYAPEGEFRNIEIRTDVSDLVFKPATDGKLSVVCVEREKVRHNVSVENGTLKIVSEDKRAWTDFITLFTKNLSVTVYLPEAEYETLKIKNSTGDVELAGYTFGSIDIDNSTGDITLGNVSAGNISLSVSTGEISVTSTTCDGEFTLKTSTGDVELKDVTCKRFVSSGSTGDFELTDLIASESLSIDVSTGDVFFKSCDAPQIKVKTSTGDIKGTLRTGKTFSTKTSTGSVKVPKDGMDGTCELKTSTGDISISIG
ncbi:MAG: DUF4097 family beta strand repeat protein [Clostridia bacterium]|nr:DUF4097 family beta strand repeat protein [Clostridia bacterium]